MGEAWEMLTETERLDAWDRFYDSFDFRPSVYDDQWPGIKEPTPSQTYSISAVYNTENFDDLVLDLNLTTLTALQKCVGNEQPLHALDWQHPCYWFYPHRPFEAYDPEAWKVPVLPNGDYYIFLAQDLSFGLFGHPWEDTICVFGQTLLEAFAQDPPLLFVRPLRIDGKPLTNN